jgi:hypothetical protein
VSWQKFVRSREDGGTSLNYSWFDLAGLVGVVLIVIAYLLLQLGKLPSSAPSYSLLNAIGAFMVMVSLYFDFNLSAFLMEAFWFLISLFGLVRPFFSKPVAANH